MIRLFILVLLGTSFLASAKSAAINRGPASKVLCDAFKKSGHASVFIDEKGSRAYEIAEGIKSYYVVGKIVDIAANSSSDCSYQAIYVTATQRIAGTFKQYELYLPLDSNMTRSFRIGDSIVANRSDSEELFLTHTEHLANH